MKSLSPLMFLAKVDPNYHFNEEKENVSKRKYLYEFSKEPLCDGLLVSKTMLEGIKNLRNIKNKFRIRDKGKGGNSYSNVRDFLSLKKIPSYITFADPGTWSYVHKLELPDFLYDQESVFNYYNSLKFDLCGSIDWPIIDKIRIREESGKVHFRELSIKEKEHRRHLTTDLAKAFLKKCSSKKVVNFVPFGTVQGYSVNTYISSLKKVLKMGYKYVAIGGLPSYSEKRVLELLIPIKKCMEKYGRKNVGLHLYGRFPSPNAVLAFAKAGVTSFDNNSPYITATKSFCTVYNSEFLRGDNPTSPMSLCYCVKIPSIRGPSICRFKKGNPKSTVDLVMDIVNRCYKSFVTVAEHQSSSNIKKFIILYRKMYHSFQKHNISHLSKNKLEETLFIGESAVRSNLWKKCGCTACTKAKTHITLVRGITRIRYTFMHNSYVQYTRYLKDLENPTVQKYIAKYDWSLVYKKKQRNINKMNG